MAGLLLELFSEEIPARMQARAADELKKAVVDRLKEARLDIGDAVSYVTPRRLVLMVDGLPACQPDIKVERKGPKVSAPEQAVEGFLKSVGLTLEQCEQRETPKGAVWFAVREEAGRETAVVLGDLLSDALRDIFWAKSMRWGQHALRWVRPLHAILCRFDGAVVPFEFGHLRAGNITRGHRFMAPGSFQVADADDYRSKLLAAKVMLDPEDRKDAIWNGALALAEAEGLVLEDAPALLAENAGLNEWPTPFHAKLGSLGDKVRRIAALSADLSKFVPDANGVRAIRAAKLAKADLVTAMVGEFPDLQGIMGAYYARHAGEDEAVAQAISDHYRPQGPSDACPSAPESVTVALADKIDTLVGFFAIDEKPTGSKDPFALRRAALGVIRLVLENDLRLPLKKVFADALSRYDNTVKIEDRADDLVDGLLDFFADRLKVHLRERGVRHDLVAAVFALDNEDDLVRLMARVEALSAFIAGEDGANLLTAYKRAANILRIEEKKDGRKFAGDVDAEQLIEAAEKSLVAEIGVTGPGTDSALAAENFTGAMAVMAQLRGPVDAFFDGVTVNAEAPILRENRLNLLASVRDTLDQVADFSKIEG